MGVYQGKENERKRPVYRGEIRQSYLKARRHSASYATEKRLFAPKRRKILHVHALRPSKSGSSVGAFLTSSHILYSLSNTVDVLYWQIKDSFNL